MKKTYKTREKASRGKWQKQYFDQLMWCAAPICWSKFALVIIFLDVFNVAEAAVIAVVPETAVVSEVGEFLGV